MEYMEKKKEEKRVSVCVLTVFVSRGGGGGVNGEGGYKNYLQAQESTVMLG